MPNNKVCHIHVHIKGVWLQLNTAVLVGFQGSLVDIRFFGYNATYHGYLVQNRLQSAILIWQTEANVLFISIIQWSEWERREGRDEVLTPALISSLVLTLYSSKSHQGFWILTTCIHRHIFEILLSINFTVKPDVLLCTTLLTSTTMLVFWLTIRSEQLATGSNNLLVMVANVLASLPRQIPPEIVNFPWNTPKWK